MVEGKRQKQVAGVINEALNEIFRKIGINIIQGGMVSISSVKVTPDLLEARIYLSFFQIADKATALKKVEERQWEVKKELALSIKHQLRRVPELRFFLDDTLDHVSQMEELFKQLNENSPKTASPDMDKETGS
jgi:ribosome-binding factor A